jgi:hypothetical protein
MQNKPPVPTLPNYPSPEAFLAQQFGIQLQALPNDIKGSRLRLFKPYMLPSGTHLLVVNGRGVEPREGGNAVEADILLIKKALKINADAPIKSLFFFDSSTFGIQLLGNVIPKVLGFFKVSEAKFGGTFAIVYPDAATLAQLQEGQSYILPTESTLERFVKTMSDFARMPIQNVSTAMDDPLLLTKLGAFLGSSNDVITGSVENEASGQES